MKTLKDHRDHSEEQGRIEAEVDAVVNARFLVGDVMLEKGMSQADLARKLGKSRSWVNKITTGGQNLTLRSLAGMLHCLGYELELVAKPLKQGDDCRVVTSRDEHLSEGEAQATSLPHGEVAEKGSA